MGRKPRIIWIIVVFGIGFFVFTALEGTCKDATCRAWGGGGTALPFANKMICISLPCCKYDDMMFFVASMDGFKKSRARDAVGGVREGGAPPLCKQNDQPDRPLLQTWL